MSDPTVGARVVAAIALVALATIGIFAVGYTTHVEVRSDDAPAEMFSVERARTAVAPIVATPRVPGTADHAAARDYLVAHFDELGWDTEVVEAVGRFVAADDAIERLGRVQNIVATLPGTDPTGTVVLAAHYDTVAGSPGAADDGLGVATALEAARALDAAGPQRNTIMVLLTDGEESGLLGAEAFGRDPTRSPSEAPMVVINNEARGSSGLPSIFRTSTPNAELARIVSRIRGAALDTGGQAAFELLPNDTDFTRFEEAGMAGIDAAITGSSANYHSATDTADRLSSASLQRMGDVSLAVAEQLAATDLTTIDANGSVVAASVLDRTIAAPRWVEWTMVAVTVLGAAILVVVRRRHGDRRAAVLIAAATGVAVIPIGALAAVAPWWLTATLNPTMVSSLVGDPYRPGALQIAGTIAAVAAVALVTGLLRLRLSRSEVGTGLLLGAALLVVVAATLPGFGLTFGAAVLPMPAAAIATTRTSPAVAAAVTAVAAVPAVVILTPFATAMFDVGLEMGGSAAGLAVVLLYAGGYPIIDVLIDRRSPGIPTIVPIAAVAVVSMVILAAMSVAANASSPHQPIQESIVYALDRDAQSARFIGGTDPKSEWAQDLLPERGDVEIPGRGVEFLPFGPASTVDLPGPEVEVLSDEVDGDNRTLTVQVSSRRDASEVHLRIADDVVVAGPVEVAGRAISTADGANRSGLTVRFTGDSTVTVRFTVVGTGDTLDLDVADGTADVADIPELSPPDNVVVNSPSTFVLHSVTL